VAREWDVGDIGVLGGTESDDAPPQGEMGDTGNRGVVDECVCIICIILWGCRSIEKKKMTVMWGYGREHAVHSRIVGGR